MMTSNKERHRKGGRRNMKKVDVSREFNNVPVDFLVYYNETLGVYTLENYTDTWLSSDDYREFQDELNKLVIEYGLEVE